MTNGETNLNTGGGATVGNNVQTGGGAFVGRDQINLIVQLGSQEEVHLKKEGDLQAVRQARLYNVPILPTHYLVRDDHLRHIKELLLKDSRQTVGITGISHAVGLHGMGGIGKSILAAALAYDPAIRAAFPDGVIWISLGQNPDIVDAQNGILKIWANKSLADNESHGRLLLNQQLANKKLLLILDDVWQVKHAEHFGLSTGISRLLITTRLADVLVGLSAEEYKLDILSRQQAIHLLRIQAKCEEETLPEEAEEIVNECGALPLAISMVGAMLRNKPANRWQRVLQLLQNAELQKIRQELAYYPYTDLFKAIHVSIEVQPPFIQKCYLELVIFPENELIPENVLEIYWKQDNFQDHDAIEVIDALLNASLIFRHNQNLLTLHDLQRDYLRVQLRIQSTIPATQHAKLIENYALAYPEGWHSIPYEQHNYFYKHFIFHLQQANDLEKSRRIANELLTKQPMLDWSVIQSYLELTNQSIEQLAHILIQINKRPTTLIYCIRYIFDSLNNDEFHDLSQDHFFEMQRSFTDNQGRPARTRALIDYILRHNKISILLKAIEKIGPETHPEPEPQLVNEEWRLEKFGSSFLYELSEEEQVDKVELLRWNYFDWSKAEYLYLDRVSRLYERVRILGRSVDVRLDDIFTQVYILNKPIARYRQDINELRTGGRDRIDFQRLSGQRTPGLRLVKKEQNLFILGKPGAGKTTLLKYITVQAARKQLPRIPIFVSLNQWAESPWGKSNKATLLPFLVEQFDICDFPDATLFIEYLLREGRALVLFDGLDEVKQEKDQRRRLTRLLQYFAHKYNKSQHLITCSIAASDYAFAGFTDVEVADFTLNQVREYARKWFGVQKTKYDLFMTELTRPENEGLAELCKTPLLLSLLCPIFDNNQRFQVNRAELYEDALETLLRKWDSSRQIQRDEIYRQLSHKRKLQLLMQIAVPTFEKGELFFRQSDVERWIVDYLVKLPGAPPADTLDGAVILKAIEAQYSILVERAQGIYSFLYLTFHEYLTARYFAENQTSEMTNLLTHKHLTDPRWHEVFLLTAGLLYNGDEFVLAIRHATDSFITDVSSISQLLIWAFERTQGANVPNERQQLVQLAYVFLALAFDGVVALDLSLAGVLDPDLVLALALALDLARTQHIDRVQDLDLSLALALAQELSLNLVQSLDLSLAFGLVTTPLVGFDYGLYYCWSYASLFACKAVEVDNKDWQAAMQQFPLLVKGIAELASNIRLTNLAQQLTKQDIPLPKSSKQVWQQYADKLFAIIREQRDLGHKWNFAEKEITKLNKYFYATELLVQCLKIASVTDRQAVLNGLLLPSKS